MTSKTVIMEVANVNEAHAEELGNYSIKAVLMRRDGVSSSEADELLADARREVAEGADPEEVLYESFGLEPDYIFDLLSDVDFC